ncbi:Alpha-agarase [Pontiella sulfatireligans]|uniref:Alpha-agarase n=1 Tax=Pontiella sulfatireligans TaxID=2750658 RepID=A0A6C2UUZ4_9BACT|nr:Alpha-agarase [Pontiella sulfatireligans]
MAVVASVFSAFAGTEPGKDAAVVKKYPYPFKYSDVISDNISIVPVDRIIKDWGGNVLMWGEPAISDIDYNGENLYGKRIERKILKGKEDGVRIYIGSCFFLLHSMYHKFLAADPTLQEAAIRDIEGNRLTVPWMAGHTYRGVPLYWSCANNPRTRQFYREVITENMKAGYDGIVIEEPRGAAHGVGAGGCFCDHCMELFRVYMGKTYSPVELKKRGIDNIDTFDYREMVKPIANTREAYLKAKKKGKIPLAEDFMEFHLKEAANLVGEMSDLARSLGGEDTVVGLFGLRLGPEWLLNSHHIDFYASELAWGPPAEDGYKGVSFTFEVARALGKPHAWTYISPNQATFIKNHNSFNLVKAWIAMSYAAGQHFNIPHYAWAMPEAKVDVWNGRPSFKQGCSPHLYFPTESYLPFFRFVTEHAELFDGYDSIEQIGVLHSSPALRNRKFEQRVHDMCWELYESNIQYGLAIAGDDWVVHDLKESDADRFEFVIVPEPTKLDDAQQQIVDTWTAAGKTVKWKDVNDILSRIDPVVSLESDSGIFVRPRKNPDNALVPAVIHLLNTDYDLKKDGMNEQRDVVVRLSHKLLNGGTVHCITQYSPEDEPVQLSFEVKPDGVYVTVPKVDFWSVLKPECINE